MKHVKRMTALTLVVIIMMSVMVLPASAALTDDPYLKPKIQAFPYLYNGVDYPSAVRALQRFLMFMPDYSAADVLISDGLDGGYGNHVEAAVRYFQVLNGIGEAGEDPNNPDGTGEVSTRTWGAIADNLYETDTSEDYARLCNISGARIYYVDTSTSTYNFAYYTSTSPYPSSYVYWKTI